MKEMDLARIPSALFRAVYKEFRENPIPSRSRSGRFHCGFETQLTSYLAATGDTALAEVTYRWNAAVTAYCLAEVTVRLQKIADLTDPETRSRYGVDAATLVGDDYRECQRIAQQIRQDGFEAIWTYSRADQPEGRQLVVFLDRLQESSEIRVESVTDME